MVYGLYNWTWFVGQDVDSWTKARLIHGAAENVSVAAIVECLATNFGANLS